MVETSTGLRLSIVLRTLVAVTVTSLFSHRDRAKSAIANPPPVQRLRRRSCGTISSRALRSFVGHAGWFKRPLTQLAITATPGQDHAGFDPAHHGRTALEA